MSPAAPVQSRYSTEELVELRRSALRYARSFPAGDERNKHRKVAISLRVLYRRRDWLSVRSLKDTPAPQPVSLPNECRPDLLVYMVRIGSRKWTRLKLSTRQAARYVASSFIESHDPIAILPFPVIGALDKFVVWPCHFLNSDNAPPNDR
jgi:hypothetical protein